MSASEERPAFRGSVAVSRVVRGLIVVYTMVAVLFGFLQRQLLYAPQPATSLSVVDFQDVTSIFPASIDVAVMCGSGVTLRGWLLRTSDAREGTATRPLVIYFHGNAGNRADRGGWYDIFHDAGADVLAMDYHGYGDSGGTMTERALELTADATWKFALEDLGYRSSQIVVAGTSLGGAAAVYLASQQSESGNNPAALVTVATFSSMVDVARSHYPWLPVNAILVDRYPSVQRIPRVSCPIVAIHGDNDAVVQQKFGRRLFDAAPSVSSGNVEKKWINLQNVGHNDLLANGRDSIRRELKTIVAAVNEE